MNNEAAFAGAVQRITVECRCGCGALSTANLGGAVLARLWPDQIRFTMNRRWLAAIFGVAGWLMRLRAGSRVGVALVEFTDGSRIQISPPAILYAGAWGELATRRPTEWRPLARASVLS